MPTYNQSAFIRRAIRSVLVQTYSNWELIIINDGCTDDTEDYIKDYLADSRIRYMKNPENKGIGYAINQGLDIAQYDHIAYLPSDDYYYDCHLNCIKNAFEKSEDIFLVRTTASSKVRDSFLKEEKTITNGLFDRYCLQLVQTSHRKTSERWRTRDEWVTNDYFDLFWRNLVDKGEFVMIEDTTCYWTNHPQQYHKLVSETYKGGLNIYRQYYNIKQPIKMKVSSLKFIDEEKQYNSFLIHRTISHSDSPLKILILGELGYNGERILAFEERGHKLYGLWTKRPEFSFSGVGPMPFGNITDINYEKWASEIKEIKPDIIYATQSSEVVPLAYAVHKQFPDIPFILHIKEGPFKSIRSGTWSKLIELLNNSDGAVFINQEIKSWYEQFMPEKKSYIIVDGDMPKIDCFTDEFSPLLSEQDGEVHTVCPGRIVGVTQDNVLTLANHGVHVHLYIENYYKDSKKTKNNLMSDYFHVHQNCTAGQWVKEFSKYDAGWLHCFDSQNDEKIEKFNWDDMNIPSRLNTLAAAGLPMITKRNAGHTVVMRSVVEKYDMGVLFDDFNELAVLLKDKARLKKMRENVLKNRYVFSFDYHVDNLIDFFREVVETKKVMKQNKVL